MKTPLRFRQVHLDFHTSPFIDGIGTRFDRKKYQETLKRAAVNSVTTFATCHHGWSYYDTKVGKRHPGLKFDLLRAQFEAAKEIGVNVPIYLTAGVHNLAADEHPEWREVGPDGRYCGWTPSNLKAGFMTMSFHSPYLDYLVEQVQEVVRLFPEADGIFYDIINQGEDCSVWGLRHMQAKGLNPLVEADRRQSRLDALMKYYERATAAVRDISPDMPVFHNSGHVTPGFREVLPFFSHLELESLPTGGWGYDHFPQSAKYAHKLGMEFLGMTGKFHTTWGEFGGYKHPNALRYECGAMLAFGAKCSVGDQLHPTGEMDASTYEIIGAAYREVAEKERFVEGAVNVADVGLLNSQSTDGKTAFLTNAREKPGDVGAGRVLLEEHVLFDILDTQMDFSGYRLLILPDDVVVDAALEAKLRAFVAAGGKLLLSADSAVDPLRGMLFDVGATVGAPSEFSPDYWKPRADLAPAFARSPMVMYGRGRRVTVTDGESLGDVYDPYFNREWNHFCSHQHTPPRPEPSGFAAAARKGNLLYFAHPIFSIYRSFGQVALRQAIGRHLDLLLGGDRLVKLENFPSTGRVSLTHQTNERRHVLHLLNGPTINRGGKTELHGGTTSSSLSSYEVIEDERPLHDVKVRVRLPEAVSAVKLEPQGRSVDFAREGDWLSFTVDRVGLHQMVVFYH